jgi:hypothetical protein
VGEHLVVKDYNIKILEANSHVHLIIDKKNCYGLVWNFYLPK